MPAEGLIGTDGTEGHDDDETDNTDEMGSDCSFDGRETDDSDTEDE
jgi:hypothetical protein